MKHLNFSQSIFVALLVACIFMMPAVSVAITITDGFTFAVASAGGGSVGTHFHSSTGGEFGNPAGKAEVGDFFTEDVRGLSEYDLTGLVAGPAFVTFNVFLEAGLFPGDNDFPFIGDIDIIAYQGNNAEDMSDFEALSVGGVATFNTAGLSVGDTLSFDITSIYGDALNNGWSSLGMRLQVPTGPSDSRGAFTFDTFRLSSTDETTIPEPSTMLLLGSGLFSLGALRKKFKR